jgi:hypothetical protein
MFVSPCLLQGYYGYDKGPCENATESVYLYGRGHVCIYVKEVSNHAALTLTRG